MVVVYLHRVPCPRAEGGAYNSTGRGVRACNTFWALRRPGGSKAPVQSFPGSTFPTRAQGMVLEAVVDLNVLSYTVPVIMRGRERRNLALGRGGAGPKASGETEASPLPSGPFALGRGGVGLEASSETKPNFHHSGKERSGALVRPEVFNVRWLLVPPSGVSWY